MFFSFLSCLYCVTLAYTCNTYYLFLFKLVNFKVSSDQAVYHSNLVPNKPFYIYTKVEIWRNLSTHNAKTAQSSLNLQSKTKTRLHVLILDKNMSLYYIYADMVITNDKKRCYLILRVMIRITCDYVFL